MKPMRIGGTKAGTAVLRKVPMSQTSGAFQDGLSVLPRRWGRLLFARSISGDRGMDC